MNSTKIFLGILLAFFSALSACTTPPPAFDATGSFEAVERIISAEASGVIRQLHISEGQRLAVGDTIGYIDVSRLELEGERIQASIQAIDLKTTNATPQITSLNAQLGIQESQIATLNQRISNIDREIERFTNLVNQDAAPRKSLDDLVAQKKVMEKELGTINAQKNSIKAQITAAKEEVALRNRAIKSDEGVGKKQLEIVKKQLKDGLIVNQYQGDVLVQYAYDGEYTTIGKPIYKIADLSTIILRAYISGNQLAQVQLNQKVKVLTDDGNGGYKETEGIVSWISDKAEFTPKTIQTKDERANLVYAIKVKVKNDGSYKIGMYGEIKFL